MDYEIGFYDCDGVYVVPVTGEFDLANADVLETTIQAALQGERIVVVDLSATKYIDSTVLTLLVRQKKREGSRVRIVVPPDGKLRKIFEITGLYAGLSIADSIQAAIADGAS